MDGSWGSCRSFVTLSVNVTWLPLVSSFAFYFFDGLLDWCMTGHFQGVVFGNESAVRSVVSFLMLTFNFRCPWWMGKWITNFDYTHFHTPFLKNKNTRSLGSAFCCDILSFYSVYVSMGSDLSRKWPSSSNTHIRSPFALALDFTTTHFFL